MLNNNLYMKIGNRRIKLFDFTWILFLGVLPFDKAALTLFTNSSLGEVISISLNAITLFGAFVCYLYSHTKTQKKVAQKYISFFVVLAITYLFAGFVDEIIITRFFSLICLLGYYIFAICHYKGTDKLIRDINKAAFFIILLSTVLYIAGDNNVMYTEKASKMVFKGIAANRNSYSEISLFFIATNFYIWRQEKKWSLWRFLTTLLAVYTTFLTNGATSIICVCLLLLLLLVCNNRVFSKIYSFNFFALIYIVLFCVIVLSQYTDVGVLQYISTLFGKTTSMTGRTDIWATTIASISKSPIFGLGYDTSVLLNQGIYENDPHNGLLYIVLTQGIIGLITFIGMLLFVIKNSKNYKHRNNNAYMTMLAFIVVWLIKGLVESAFSYSHFVFWCALIIMELCIYDMADKNYEQLF